MISRNEKPRSLSSRGRGKEKKKSRKSGNTSRRTDRLLSIIILLGMVISSALLVYPSFADALSSVQQSTVISSYASSLSGVAKERLADAKKQAAEYNAYIRKKQKQKPFAYAGTGIKDRRYQKILNVSNDGIMGYIEIPKISVSLPIGHGTSSDVLDSGSGHIYGTSVPIGGKSAHSAISAHTGLQSAKMFTDIDQLKKGDRFSIHVLNEIHYYRVISIRTETPHKADRYLQVQDGKDLVTLYTCTPYGVNTHRLLVTAEADGSETEEKTKSSSVKINDWANRMTLKAAVLAMVPLFILAAGLIRIFREEIKERIRSIRKRAKDRDGKEKDKICPDHQMKTKQKKNQEEKEEEKNTFSHSADVQKEPAESQLPPLNSSQERIRQLEGLAEWLSRNDANQK